MVTAQMAPLVEAQIANAKGIKFLMVREKETGKFKRVSETMAKGLNPDEEIIEVWEKDPSVQAFTDLMNRALDKPTEQVNVDANVNITGNVLDRLMAGRKRVADAKR